MMRRMLRQSKGHCARRLAKCHDGLTGAGGREPSGRRYKSWINREKKEEGETKSDGDERRGEVLKATGGAAHILIVRQVSG